MAAWKDALHAMTTTVGVRALGVLHGSRPAPRLPVRAMGLHFPNPLGLAAGFDRTGVLVKALAAAGFGFVEVGTVTHATPSRLPRERKCPVGVNIGSRHDGLGPAVADDYAAALRAYWHHADYLTANLSSPFFRRDGDFAGLDRLLARLKREQAAQTDATGRRVPLTLKLHAGEDGTPLPTAVHAAHAHAVDGLVLVSASPRRLAAVTAALDPMPVISVGGVHSGWDVQERLAAGAALVQIYTAFVRGGARYPRRLLASVGAEMPA
jgi:dihydroorotate dehydrogenase